MNRRELVISGLRAVAALSFPVGTAGQKKAIEPDLGALADGKGLNPSNRSLSRLTDGTRKGVRLSGAEGEWPVYLPDIKFANGTIELDMKGKDVQGASFIGVAFHGVDGTTYDAIYFRPFNFKTDDQARVLRAVQYVSQPAHPWQKLRTDTPGQYEKPVKPVPDPNDWFHARIVVASPKVSVFVANATEPCLTVNQLSDRKNGLIGVWVGNTSGGDFANFKIVPA
jgi:hypothetical protein